MRPSLRNLAPTVWPGWLVVSVALLFVSLGSLVSVVHLIRHTGSAGLHDLLMVVLPFGVGSLLALVVLFPDRAKLILEGLRIWRRKNGGSDVSG